MDFEFVITKLVPVILVFAIVYHNIRKMQKSMDEMKNGSCGNGGCNQCASQSSCGKDSKK